MSESLCEPISLRMIGCYAQTLDTQRLVDLLQETQHKIGPLVSENFGWQPDSGKELD